MKFSARQIAELIDGTVVGNPNVEVSALSKIEEGTSGTLSFLANPAYETHIYTTQASVVIVNSSFEPEQAIPETCTLIKVKNAYQSFAKLLEVYNQYRYSETGIDPAASVSAEAKIGQNVYIGPFVAVGAGTTIADNVKIYAGTVISRNASVGANSILHPGCKVLSDCVIGENCVLHAGVVIGGDGFGFAPNSENNYNKVPQIGNVILEAHVEIGANTTVDRATLGSTIIRKGVKIDNLVQIAHNVEIGENTVIAAQTGIAGSTKIGKNCMIGGQVGITGHLKIADGTKIAAQSGIGSNITTPNTTVQGSPAFDIGQYRRSYVGFRNLAKISEQIKLLEQELQNLKRTAE